MEQTYPKRHSGLRKEEASAAVWPADIASSAAGPPSSSLLSISLSPASAEKGSASSKLFQKMTSFTKKDKLLQRMTSSSITKYDNAAVSPRERGVEFGSAAVRVEEEALSSDGDGDDEVDYKDQEDALTTLWERRVVRMVVDNNITRVDMRRLRLQAFPAGLLHPVSVAIGATSSSPLNESLASSSSLLEARLRKGTALLHKHTSGRTLTRISPASFVEVLDLQHNRIAVIPDEISMMTALRVLSLAHNQLSHVPSALFELSNLQTLDLSFNKLPSVPAEASLMEKLVNLRNLILDSNQLVSLPSSLNKLTALQFLSVRKNVISSNHVASDLSGMVSLKGLDLSSNRLGEIPRQLCALPSLLFLSLADNQLTYIREEMPIASLTSLTSLDLSNNMLSEVGPQAASNLRALPNLTDLRLVNNQLQELPEEFSDLVGKGILNAEGNEGLTLLDGKGIARSYPMLGRNRGLHKKASTQDIREFLGVLSTPASRNSVNVFVNPLAIESPITSQRLELRPKEKDLEGGNDKKEHGRKRAKAKAKRTTKRKDKAQEKAKLKKRRHSSSSGDSPTSNSNSTVRRTGSDFESAQWRDAWRKGKAKSDFSGDEGEEGEEGESGYESNKSTGRYDKDEITEDESSLSSSESGGSSSSPSSGIKKKGKAILEFISRDRIKREDEGGEGESRMGWLWRKSSREKVVDRVDHITAASPSPSATALTEEPSQHSPRAPLTPAGSLAQGLVLPCAGWRIEGSSRSDPRRGCMGEKYQLEEEANYSFAYRDLFFPYRHVNYLGSDPELGPVAISIRKAGHSGDGSFLYLMRYDQSTIVGHVPAECYRRRRGKSAALLSALKKAIHPTLLNANLAPVKDEEYKAAMLKLEEQMLVAAHKFGVIFAKENQITENELFSNQESDEAFDAFLELLGLKVDLRGWQGYTGGLDTGKNLSDGAQSVFTQWKGLDIMFHVSTMIPFNPKDEQQIGRKRHIGNDVVVLVFVSGKTPFSPISIQSQFNNVFVAVQHIPSDDPHSPSGAGYKVAVTVKSNIPDFGPLLPDPPVFCDPSDFREFLLTKLVNSERAAYKRNQLGVSIQRTRNILLSELVKRYAPEKYGTSDADVGKTRSRSQSDPAASGKSSSQNAAAPEKQKKRKNTTLPRGSTVPFSSSERDVPIQSSSSSSSASSAPTPSASSSFLASSSSATTFPRGDSSPRKKPSVPLRTTASISTSTSGGSDPKAKREAQSPGPSPRAGNLTPHTFKHSTSRSKIEQPAPTSGSNSPRSLGGSDGGAGSAQAAGGGVTDVPDLSSEGSMKFWKRKKRAKSFGSKDK